MVSNTNINLVVNNMSYKIMIIEDDRDISLLLKEHLIKFNYDVYIIEDFNNIIDEFKNEKPDLVLLDINLPVCDGFYWCNRIRLISSCPILFMSSRNADSDQIYAIMSGGDDYITKPFSTEVLVAKISATLRRIYGEYANNESDDLMCLDCTFSKSRMILSSHDRMVELSKTEAGIIRLMFQNYPQISSRDDLLNEIWDDDSFVEENTLNVTISRVRKKLEMIQSCLTIKPVRGVGYRIGDIKNER